MEENTDKKLVRISLQLIVKRHLPPESSGWSHEKIVDELNKIGHLRLDRENIGYIDNLELLGSKLTNVYLQMNKIETIENLECLQSVKFITLANNRIRTIQGLSCLKNLKFLDLSENLIQMFDIDELPQSLIILNLQGNPCTHMSDYRGRVIQDMPNLRNFDGEEVTKIERQECGYRVSSSEDESDDSDEEKSSPIIKDQYQTTHAILLRSQSRLEKSFKEHHKHLDELDELRIEYHLPPSARQLTEREKSLLTERNSDTKVPSLELTER